MEGDERFKSFTDPKFKPIKKKQKKHVIDERFESVFTDKKFQSETRIDKRGAPNRENSTDELKKFYRVKKDSKKKKTKSNKVEKPSKETEESVTLVEEEDQKFSDVDEDEAKGQFEKEKSEFGNDSSSEEESSDEEPDMARGEGLIESSDDSDTDEEYYKDDNVVDEIEHEWNELDSHVVLSEDVSKRLALCNMDWDRIKAVDIFMLFNSFKSATGTVKKVSIYLSDFGKKRMKNDNEEGPKEMQEAKVNEDLAKADEFETKRYHNENLRKYQLNRLKYYYAIIEFDSEVTADEVYKSCDGEEFEQSSAKIDLRFVPEDLTFDDEPTDVCDQMLGKDTYEEPKRFVTTALNQSKVDITWDETDVKRKSILNRKWTEKELESFNNDDISAYLASSSDEDDDDDEKISNDPFSDQPASSRPFASVSRTSKQADIDRYRALLLGTLEEVEEEDDKDVHMECTFQDNSRPTKESEVEALDDDEDDDLEGEAAGDLSSGENDSDDDSGDDIDKKVTRKEGGKRVKFSDDKTDVVKVVSAAELEMLMIEPEKEGEPQHFNMDKIQKSQEQSRKSNKRKKRKKEVEVVTDNFKLDIDDQRFSGVFTSSDFAIDPNNPSFKKTNAMLKLVEEKGKRGTSAVRKVQKAGENDSKPATNVDSNVELEKLSSIIKNLESKSKGVNRMSKVSKAKSSEAISAMLKTTNNNESEQLEPQQTSPSKDSSDVDNLLASIRNKKGGKKRSSKTKQGNVTKKSKN